MALGWLLAAVVAAPDGATELTLTAERVLHDGATKRTIAEGRAHLVTDGAALDAERIYFDQPSNTVIAVGAVLGRVVQGATPMVLKGEVVELQLEGERIVEAHVLHGDAFAKAGANRDKLLAATTDAELEAAGKSTMRMSGNHFVRVDDGWRMEQLELTPCDCDLSSPSWSIRTSEAVLNKDGDRVAVKWPVTWVKKLPIVGEAPVFGLPWLSIPLGDRATGLLFPKPGSTSINGFSLEQPVFVTAGRSADFTFTPGYFFGGARAAQQQDRPRIPETFGTPWRNAAHDAIPDPYASPFGVVGPRLLTEFRYVLSPRAQGRATLGLLYDLRGPRDPGFAGLMTLGQRGLRGEASLQHQQDFGSGFGTRVDLGAYSDGYYQRDVTVDVIARENGYLRSSAVLFHRGADHLLTLDTVLRQDLTTGYDLFGRDVFPRGSTAPKYGPNTIQRLPAISFSMPLRPLVGPLAFDFTADAVQQTPLRFGTGDEGALANEGRFFDPFTGAELSAECLVERLYLARPANQLSQCPRAFDPSGAPYTPVNAAKVGLGDGRWQPGEREARTRLDAVPRLWVGGTALGAIGWSATAAYRQGLWLGWWTERVISRGYPLLSAKLETELTRTFSGSLRHTITPMVELRAVPFVLATAPTRFDPSILGGPAPYDEIDRSIGDNRPRVQAVAELRNRLVESGREVLRLELGQGFDLLSPVTPGPGGVFEPQTQLTTFNAPRLAEAYGRLNAIVGPATLAGLVRVEPLWRPTPDAVARPRVTRAAASVNAELPLGFGVRTAYEFLLDDGSNRSRAPVDLLFGDPVIASATSKAQLWTAGASARFGTLGLRYDIVFLNRVLNAIDEAGAPILQSNRFALGQQTVSVTWTPACDCFRLDATMMQRLSDNGALLLPEFVGFNFSISKFGSFGATR